ncbi:MAG: NifU family protein [Gemmatimonadota bacterium]
MMNKEEKIQEVLDQIRPAIHADGGDVEFVGYDEAEGVVHVRLMGACESCPISMLTLKEGIERRIRSTLPEVTEVLAV